MKAEQRCARTLAATMPEVSGDGLTWTFRLKDGIAYGPPLEDTQVVAGDIIRALDREAVMASGDTYAFYYSVIEGFDAMVRGEADSISGMEAPDDRTLVVHLTHPAGDLADLFAMPATAPIPAAPSEPSTRLGVAGGVDAYGSFLVASGPYMIEGSEQLDLSVPPEDRAPISGYTPGRSLTLVRNPSWDRETDALRPAYVDRIEVTISSSVGEAVRQVQSGEADLYVHDGPAPQIRPDVVERFMDHPELGVHVYVELAIWFGTSRSILPSLLWTTSTCARRSAMRSTSKPCSTFAEASSPGISPATRSWTAWRTAT